MRFDNRIHGIQRFACKSDQATGYILTLFNAFEAKTGFASAILVYNFDVIIAVDEDFLHFGVSQRFLQNGITGHIVIQAGGQFLNAHAGHMHLLIRQKLFNQESHMLTGLFLKNRFRKGRSKVFAQIVLSQGQRTTVGMILRRFRGFVGGVVENLGKGFTQPSTTSEAGTKAASARRFSIS